MKQLATDPDLLNLIQTVVLSILGYFVARNKKQ